MECTFRFYTSCSVLLQCPFQVKFLVIFCDHEKLLHYNVAGLWKNWVLTETIILVIICLFHKEAAADLCVDVFSLLLSN